jgi:nitrite reductase/ring-hydroxylating ferredoxin subunit
MPARKPKAPTNRAQALCRLDDLTPGTVLRVEAPLGGETREFLVLRRGEADGLGDDVVIFPNACPHIFINLDLYDGWFMTQDGQRLLCGQHWAEFRLPDGLCVAGPCVGRSLEPIPAVIEDGAVYLGDFEPQRITWPTRIIRFPLIPPKRSNP